MFSRLKLYTVHTQLARDASSDRPLFVREGFSLPAFALTVFWALYHRCWRFAAIIMLAEIAIYASVYAGFANQASFTLAQFFLQVLIGYHAHDFLRARLARAGYALQDIASGESMLRAEQRYFDRLLAHI